MNKEFGCQDMTGSIRKVLIKDPQSAYKNQENIEVIGLNYKDNNKNAKKFLEELDNPYKIILLDEDGTISIEWGAYGVPETFLIYDKKIIKKVVGPLNEILLKEINELIHEVY